MAYLKDRTLVYDTVEDLHQDIHYVNSNILVPYSCLTYFNVWKNKSNSECYNIKVLFLKDLELVDKPVYCADDGLPVYVKDIGRVYLSVEVDALWQLGGKISNSKGPTVGYTGSNWKIRLGISSSIDDYSSAAPCEAVSLLHLVNNVRTDKTKNYEQLSVDDLVDCISSIYIRGSKYTVPPSMAEYLIKVCNVPETRLLKNK